MNVSALLPALIPPVSVRVSPELDDPIDAGPVSVILPLKLFKPLTLFKAPVGLPVVPLPTMLSGFVPSARPPCTFKAPPEATITFVALPKAPALVSSTVPELTRTVPANVSAAPRSMCQFRRHSCS